MRFWTFGLAIALLAQLGAQSPAPTSSVFRSGISYIELDASVLDRDRNPVRGLAAGDFTVLEDGQPQKILTFTEVNVPDPEPPPVAWMREVTPDVQANDAYEALNRRLVVILLDDAQIRIDKTQSNRTQEVARIASRTSRPCRSDRHFVHANSESLAGLHQRSREAAQGHRRVHQASRARRRRPIHSVSTFLVAGWPGHGDLLSGTTRSCSSNRCPICSRPCRDAAKPSSMSASGQAAGRTF